MTGGNPIGRGFHATPYPDNSSIDGERFTHPILQSVTLFARFRERVKGKGGARFLRVIGSHCRPFLRHMRNPVLFGRRTTPHCILAEFGGHHTYFQFRLRGILCRSIRNAIQAHFSAPKRSYQGPSKPDSVNVPRCRSESPACP